MAVVSTHCFAACGSEQTLRFNFDGKLGILFSVKCGLELFVAWESKYLSFYGGIRETIFGSKKGTSFAIQVKNKNTQVKRYSFIVGYSWTVATCYANRATVKSLWCAS